jgi:hypothetical protein
MLKIRYAAILILGVLAAVNGLKCYKSCTSAVSGCESDQGTATDTAYDCASGETVCVKTTSKDGTVKACSTENVCEAYEALIVLAQALDDGSSPDTTKNLESAKCFQCTGNLCNSATMLYAGALTSFLASAVALVNVHY